jgi:hypothetical protein
MHSINDLESSAWTSFLNVVKDSLGNHKSENYQELVHNMLEDFRKLGCNMSIKVHYVYNNLDKFPENLGSYSEEQRERFHQDLKIMEARYNRGHAKVNDNLCIFRYIKLGSIHWRSCSLFSCQRLFILKIQVLLHVILSPQQPTANFLLVLQ